MNAKVAHPQFRRNGFYGNMASNTYVRYSEFKRKQ